VTQPSDPAATLALLGFNTAPSDTLVLTAENKFEPKGWLELKPGDIIKLHSDQIFPADVSLLQPDLPIDRAARSSSCTHPTQLRPWWIPAV
jgi:magnesium-transporting ATPase (P-type)